MFPPWAPFFTLGRLGHQLGYRRARAPLRRRPPAVVVQKDGLRICGRGPDDRAVASRGWADGAPQPARGSRWTCAPRRLGGFGSTRSPRRASRCARAVSAVCAGCARPCGRGGRARAGDRRHEEVEEPVRVRRREHEQAVWLDEGTHRLEERARRVEVLDDLAADHDVGRLEPGRRPPRDCASTTCASWPSSRARRRRPPRSRSRRSTRRRQPAARAARRLRALALEQLVDEAHVDDPLAAGGADRAPRFGRPALTREPVAPQ